MGYDLIANNEDAGEFHFGAFSFPVLLDACGYLFTSIHSNGRWYCVFGVDPRMGKNYPAILLNDGFPVTEEEARIMARIARNVAAIQRTVPNENATQDMRSKGRFERDDLYRLVLDAMAGNTPDPWPVKMRPDFVDKFEKFADWADKSGGFEIH